MVTVIKGAYYKHLKRQLIQNKTVIANKPSKEIKWNHKNTQLKKRQKNIFKRRTKNRWVKQKTSCKMMDLNPTISVNTWTNKQGFLGPYS